MRVVPRLRRRRAPPAHAPGGGAGVDAGRHRPRADHGAPGRGHLRRRWLDQLGLDAAQAGLGAGGGGVRRGCARRG
ncbi:hypothetical protein B7486_75705, partial [cyanobacterium TDX16]